MELRKTTNTSITVGPWWGANECTIYATGHAGDCTYWTCKFIADSEHYLYSFWVKTNTGTRTKELQPYLRKKKAKNKKEMKARISSIGPEISWNFSIVFAIADQDQTYGISHAHVPKFMCPKIRICKLKHLRTLCNCTCWVLPRPTAKKNSLSWMS